MAAVTRKNDNGTSRQKIIGKCKPGEALLASHEADNQHSDTAVKICRANGDQVGYLFDDLGAEIVGKWSEGYRFSFHVASVTGRDKGTLGLNFLVIQAEKGVADSIVREYANQALRESQQRRQDYGD